MLKEKKYISDRILNLVIFLFLTGYCLAVIFAFMNLLSMSVSDEYAIMRNEVTLFPVGVSFASYMKVIQTNTIVRAYGNTIFVALIGCILTLLFTSLAAYPMAFGQFSGKKMYNIFIMLTLWFNGGMVPAFLVMNQLRLVDSLWALIMSSLISAFNVLILRSFFSSIPYDLIESAKIDGANDFYNLFAIVLPLSKAALATVALWVIVGHWNDFMNPLIYLRDYRKFTLQLVLRDIVLSAETSSLFDIMEGNRTAIPDQLKHAVIVVAMIPVLMIYPFVQKYFVKGVMLGAVKG